MRHTRNFPLGPGSALAVGDDSVTVELDVVGYWDLALRCPVGRKWMDQWVISPTYNYRVYWYIGVITHGSEPFTNFLRHPSIQIECSLDLVLQVMSFPD